MIVTATPPPAAGRELMRLNVVCSKHAPALVRTAFGEIRELAAIRDDVLLIASELVTNAVRHSGGSTADTLEVRAGLAGVNVLISVDDPGRSKNMPQMQNAGANRPSGHGLRIVDQLARQWGCDRGRGCRVWAQLTTGCPG